MQSCYHETLSRRGLWYLGLMEGQSSMEARLSPGAKGLKLVDKDAIEGFARD